MEWQQMPRKCLYTLDYIMVFEVGGGGVMEGKWSCGRKEVSFHATFAHFQLLIAVKAF